MALVKFIIVLLVIIAVESTGSNVETYRNLEDKEGLQQIVAKAVKSLEQAGQSKSELVTFNSADYQVDENKYTISALVDFSNYVNGETLVERLDCTFYVTMNNKQPGKINNDCV